MSNSSGNRFVAKIAVLSFVLFAVALYGQIVSFGFVWDDEHYFLAHAKYLEDGFLLNAFTTPSYSDNYYRPLGTALIHAEFRWLSSPHLLHLVGLLMVLFNGLLVFSIIKILMEKAAQSNAVFYALAGSLLYLSHPALIESTAWISAQCDIFLTFFLRLLILSDLLTKRIWL